jgi:orotate phosphoribosyltransferase
VIGLLAIFSYDFPIVFEKFKEANVELTALSNYEAVLQHLLKAKHIGEREMKTLQEWRKNPATWTGEK